MTSEESSSEPPGLAATIVEFVRKQQGCTFADLVRGVPACAGTCTVGSAFNNLLLWRGLSKEAVDALFALERSKTLRFEASTVHSYGGQGRALGLPAAM